MSELHEYDYELPRQLIAQHPLSERGDARLLVVDRRRQTFDHLHVRDLDEVLAPGDCLVLNDTRVLPARLVGYRQLTRGRWQGLFLEADDSGLWKILCKTRGKLSNGEKITVVDRDARDAMQFEIVAKLDGGIWVGRPDSNESPMDALQRVGRVPLPPYIRNGEMVDADWDTYQTIYADKPGSVAAPTAGLHFTKPIMKRVEDKGVSIRRVTLHIGRDTFRPISSDSLGDHPMHSEWGTIDADVAQHLIDVRASGGRVIPVGTTSVRVLETAAMGGTLSGWTGNSNLFIRPPFEFHAIDALMTNFHLPRTTLLVLVRTFGGDDLMRRAYQAAIDEEYRFYSYGDAMLIV